METHVVRHQTQLDIPAGATRAWLGRPGAMRRLLPPWLGLDTRGLDRRLAEGDEYSLTWSAGPVRVAWQLRRESSAGETVARDVLVDGTWDAWEHQTQVADAPAGGTMVTDEVRFRPLRGHLSRLLGPQRVAEHLRQALAYRHRTLATDLACHASYAQHTGRVLISGSHGLVGSALRSFWRAGGHEVVCLVRRGGGGAAGGQTGAADELPWDPASGEIDASRLEGFDAVVHLAGESVAGRWTRAKRQRIRDSRVVATGHLARALAGLKHKPEVFLTASGVNAYGNAGAQPVDEDSPLGTGFLADVCREWESAAEPARAAGVRVAHLRLALVVSPAGGAMARMLAAFRAGAGGRLGSGRQFWSWVALDDVLRAAHHVWRTPSLSGPVNVSAPQAVTNAAFTASLAGVLGRPAVLWMPSFAARLALGQMAEELMLSSVRAVPAKLTGSGFPFARGRLGEAFRHVLGRV